MLKIRFFALALALVLPALAGRAPIASADNNPSASGHGNITLDGALRTFSFNAVRHKDGTVTGQSELFSRGQDIRVHVDIDCLQFTNSHTVRISGTVSESSDPSIVGQPAVFRAQDNGEGSDDPPDRLSRLFIGDVSPCDVTFNPLLIEIEGGNIQVRP